MLVRSSSNNDQLMSSVAFVYEDIYGTIIYAIPRRWLCQKRREEQEQEEKARMQI